MVTKLVRRCVLNLHQVAHLHLKLYLDQFHDCGMICNILSSKGHQRYQCLRLGRLQRQYYFRLFLHSLQMQYCLHLILPPLLKVAQIL